MNRFVFLFLVGLFCAVHSQAMTLTVGQKTCTIDEEKNTFTVVDMSTLQIKEITLAEYPIHFAIANNCAYIVCREGAVLTVVDLSTFDKKHIKCVDPVYVCVVKNKVYVAEYSKSRLKVLDAQSLKSLEMIELKFLPKGICMNPSGDYIVIVNPKADSLAVFNTRNAKQMKYFKVGKLTYSGIFNDNHFYYVSYESREIGKIDCAQMRMILKEQTMCKPEHIYIEDQFIYILNKNLMGPGPKLVEIYHLNTLKFIRQFYLDNNLKNLDRTNSGISADGHLVFPFYPKTLNPDVNYKDFCTFDLENHPAPIPFLTLELVKKSELYLGLIKNPGLLQSIAYDSFSDEKVRSILENMDIESFQDLLSETQRVCDVAMWMDKAAPARKLFRWITEVAAPSKPLPENHTSSTSSTSQVSLSSSSSTSSSTSSASTVPVADTTRVHEEPTSLLSVRPSQDMARFPVAGMVHKGFKILVNHNAGTVTLDHVSSKESVEIKVGNFPTLILPLDHLVYVAVLGDKTLNEKGSIAVIDLTKRTLIDTLHLPAKFTPDRLCVSRKDLYVMDTKKLKTESYDLGTRKVSRIKKVKRIYDAGVEFYCDTCDLLHDEKFREMISEETFLAKLREATHAGDYFDSLHHYYVMYLDDVGLTQEELLAYGMKPL